MQRFVTSGARTPVQGTPEKQMPPGRTKRTKRTTVYIPSTQRKKLIEEELEEEEKEEQEKAEQVRGQEDEEKDEEEKEQEEKEKEKERTQRQRRMGVYKPSRSRQKNLDKKDKKEIESFWNEEIQTLRRIQNRIREAEKEELFEKRENVEWKYIPKPSVTRQSIFPKGTNIISAPIEKTALGDYLYMNYLRKTTGNICFIAPDLNDAIEAIQLIYSIQKKKIPFPLYNWQDIRPLIEKTNLYPMYEKTLDWISPNYDVIVEMLQIKENGPQILSTNNNKIFHLINYLLERYRINIDVPNNYQFTFPNQKQLVKCIKDKEKRYIVFILKLTLFTSGHANMIILDKELGIVERYEPLGLGHGLYIENRVNKVLEKNFNALGYEYVGPINLCPLGVQRDVSRMAKDVYHFTGFCQTWSLLYALFRLTMGDEIDAKELSKKMLEYTTDIAKEYMKETYGKDLDTAEENQELEQRKLITEFLYDFIPEILDYGKDEIKKINQAFGTKLALDGRSIVSEQ